MQGTYSSEWPQTGVGAPRRCRQRQRRPEPAWHRRERRQRQHARLLLAAFRAAQLLERHHSRPARWADGSWNASKTAASWAHSGWSASAGTSPADRWHRAADEPFAKELAESPGAALPRADEVDEFAELKPAPIAPTPLSPSLPPTRSSPCTADALRLQATADEEEPQIEETMADHVATSGSSISGTPPSYVPSAGRAGPKLVKKVMAQGAVVEMLQVPLDAAPSSF